MKENGMKAKLPDIVYLAEWLNDPSIMSYSNVLFSYKIVKNKRIIQQFFDELKPALEAWKEYKKYDEERLELWRQHAKKDKDWNPVTLKMWNDSVFDFEDKEKFEEAFTALRKKHSKAIKAYEQKIKEANETEYEINLDKIKQKELPSNMSPQDLEKISFIVDFS